MFLIYYLFGVGLSGFISLLVYNNNEYRKRQEDMLDFVKRLEGEDEIDISNSEFITVKIILNSLLSYIGLISIVINFITMKISK